jgi:hypothetical protein
MMKKIIITTVILAALTFQACSEDFLDVKQQEAVTVSDVELYNNNEGAKSFVTSIYSKYLDWSMSSFSWIGLTGIASDDADKGSEPGDTGNDKLILDNLQHNSSTLSVGEVFTANYEGINRCNQALRYIPQLDKADASLKNRLLAETKFLRAFMYFNLVRLYGGVPVVDHVPNPSSEEDITMQLARKTKAEVYAFIEKDLTDAIVGLPEKTGYAQDEKGRASKGAALALMAKVALYQQKWQKVIDFTNQLTGYALVTDYGSIFKESGENNIESIFEIQAYGGNPSKGIQGYSVSQGARGAGGWGWGFNTPSESLLNVYEAGDSRKNATIIFAGSTLYDGRVVPSTVTNPRYNYKAYSSVNPDAWETGLNLRYLRYSEMLLLRAEAFNELGNNTSAKTALNQVRNRAKLANTTAASQSEIRTAIWKERRVELAFEHDRFFDVVRTGQAQAAFAAHGKTFVVGKHEVFPLPQSFISESKGLSVQNPGY